MYIPVNLMKASELVCSCLIYHNFNNPLLNSAFPPILDNTDVMLLIGPKKWRRYEIYSFQLSVSLFAL